MLNLPLLQPLFAVDKELGFLILTFLYAAISPLQAVLKQPFHFLSDDLRDLPKLQCVSPACYCITVPSFPKPTPAYESLQDHSCSPQKLHQSHLYIPHMDTALSFLQIRAWLWLPISPSNPQRAKQASQLCQFAFSHAGIVLPFTGAPLPSRDTEKSKRIFVPRWQKSPELNQSRSLQIPIPASRERRATP